MWRRKFRFLPFWLLLWLVSVFAVGATVFAASELPDLSQTGSITITLKDEDTGEAIPGGTIAIYQVAVLVSGESGYTWQYTEDFSGCTESLDDLESLELIAGLADYAKEHALEATEITIDADGTACYEDVTLGLYLIVQTEAAEGYEAFLPFLVSVPYEKASEWVYDVDATPKMDPPSKTETEPPVEDETEPESGSETEPSSEGQTEPESGSETEPPGESESEPQSESETEAESESEMQSERGTESEIESESEAQSERGTEAESEG
ncbi:MAG: hypothetical protein LUH00_12565, partial [Lachnospiraceae bacterium]|nr:hypothetical protein [Lachnospiraceae bacterium]